MNASEAGLEAYRGGGHLARLLVAAHARNLGLRLPPALLLHLPVRHRHREVRRLLQLFLLRGTVRQPTQEVLGWPDREDEVFRNSVSYRREKNLIHA